ncbi:hypothetical protein LJ655_24080 [Paraburkholderia sp. MMS20-SJTN17]|uniref:Preprotein translocase subunit SecA n=1 Tax=Paraburkholderia translucens TaxID=2886945 RepID=A0ABS8KJI8_9BURK|nr:hypothetical protein [Paraburkholderia sp. MMS20-SJTN17]MCC8404914.1 hypothetical protein [Paraburkholderia sp. MMS20-SJTN17]
MLSPHEFATLLLVETEPEHSRLDRSELMALMDQHLVALEKTASGASLPRLTPAGHSLLHTLALLRLTDTRY